MSPGLPHPARICRSARWTAACSSGIMRWVRRITRASRPFAAALLVVLAACSDPVSSPSTDSFITPASTEVPVSATVVFATAALLDLTGTWSGPLPLTVQQKTASGSWVTVREVDGPLAVLATLPDGRYRVWDFDTLLGEFSVTRD